MDLRKESADQEESIFMDEWLYFFNGFTSLNSEMNRHFFSTKMYIYQPINVLKTTME
jgi:hypothetical protein